MNGAIDIRWRPIGAPPRKVSFRPRVDGGYLRVELEWNGCQWREVGQEIVEEVAVETAEGVAVGE